MPSKALQSLIDTFEKIDSPTTPALKPDVIQTKGIQVVHPATPRQNFNLLESPTSPTSPTASALATIPPIQPRLSSSRSESPAIISDPPSLIDFEDFALPESSFNPRPQKGSIKAKKPPPPLPPRPNDTDSSIATSFLSDSLTVKQHCYPPGPGPTKPKPKPPAVPKHLPASSISSFHSISLSSDGGKGESTDLEDSLEFLSIPSMSATPTPKLPPRPISQPLPLQTKRRPPLPPPPTFPKRTNTAPGPPSGSKITNSTQPESLLANIRIEPDARERYGTLFDRNLECQNKRKQASASTSQQKGWRAKPVRPPLGVTDSRLEGYIVKAIWECSRLNKYQLRRIWAQSNPSLHGSLDREGFVMGMWLIDEELRKVQDANRYPARRPKFSSYHR